MFLRRPRAAQACLSTLRACVILSRVVDTNDARLSVTSADGTLIRYRRFGSSLRAVVLIHGGMMASRNFVTLARLLSDRFTVIVPDRRGRGASGTYGARYSIER